MIAAHIVPTLLSNGDVAGGLGQLRLAHLDYGWLLLAPGVMVALFWWATHQRRQAISGLGNHQLIRRLVDTVSKPKRVLIAGLVVTGGALLVVGLMRPQYGGKAKVIRSSGLEMVVVVDYSKSMLAEDVYPSRSKRLEAELTRFIEESGKRGDRVGVVVFAGAARGLPVTSDMRLLNLFLERADPRTENPGGTAIGKAVTMAMAFLVDARAERSGASEGEAGEQASADQNVAQAEQVIVVMTDGEDTSSRPLELVPQAKALGIRLYTVGIGSASGEPVPKFKSDGTADGFQTNEDGSYVMTRLDETTLKQLAKETGGNYVHVESDKFGLDEVRTTLAELSHSVSQDTIDIHREEGFPFVIIPAFLALSLSLGIGERRRAA